MSMSESPKSNRDIAADKQAKQAAQAVGSAESAVNGKLQQRRRILKAAAIAAPMLVTLHAKSAFAGNNTPQNAGSIGIDYGPGSYTNDGGGGGTPAPVPITEPGKKTRGRRGR